MTPISTPAAVLRRAAADRFSRMHMERRSVMHPTDSPRATAPSDGDPVRVLLVGNGLVHGWGVASHQLAPTGELARGFRTITGTGCTVEFWGDAAMTAADARDWLPVIDHTRYDVAVVAIGSNDALRLTPVVEWRAHLQRLLANVRSRLVQDAQIVVVGVPDVYVAGTVQRLPRIVVPHAKRLDAASAALADEIRDTVFIRAPKLRALAGAPADESLYAAFTTPIATELARRVDLTLPVATTRFGRKEEEFTDPVIKALVEAYRWDELPELTRLLDGLRLRTGAVEAGVTLIDGDHAWVISADRSIPSAMPRRLTYSHAIMESGEPLVVQDSSRDLRFANIPIAHLVGLTSYVGVPLRNSAGAIIGTLGVFDRHPMAADDAEIGRLHADAEVAWSMMRATAERAVGQLL